MNVAGDPVSLVYNPADSNYTVDEKLNVFQWRIAALKTIKSFDPRNSGRNQRLKVT